MIETILGHEIALRLGAFGAVLVLVAGWEVLAPRRRPAHPRLVRWSANLAMAALNAALLRLLFPMAAVAMALTAQAAGWGVLNTFPLPAWLAVAAAVILLDLAIYGQHVLFHAVPVLWRLHRMHHADLDFDVTTGVRFHPFEIVLSMVIKLAVVAALGAPPVAVVIFEIVLNASAMFNHGNIRLPLRLDRLLRWAVVTPDMHRVHHSVAPHEANRNFGFNLPWWDHLFGTYQDQPAAGHEAMTIGIDQFRTARDLWPDRMLIQPLLGDVGDYPGNRG
jgi:sterol desaturase/sphingolipid hydroxylase (fatty acid hydroxylase superfamily)